MEEHPHAHPQPRRTHRRLFSIVLPLLLIAGGLLAFHWTHPRLKPVTRRLLPAGYNILSGWQCGFPAVQVKQPPQPASPYDYTVWWLDREGKQGKRLPEPDTGFDPGALAGNGFRCIGTLHASVNAPGKVMLSLSWPDGRHTDLDPCPVQPDSQRNPYINLHLLDNGICTDNQGHFYSPEGKLLALPGMPKDAHIPFRTATMDDQLIPISPEDGDGRLLASNFYDLRKKQPLFPTPMKFTPSFALREGRRTVFITCTYGYPYNHLLLNTGADTVTIYEGTRQLAAFSSNTTRWNCGEDGTVWRVDGKTLRVVRWRQGKPRLATLPLPVKTDKRMHESLSSFQDDTAYPAVWGDGAFVAVAETLPWLPQRIYPVAERARKLAKHKKALPREIRRLTLYQGTKNVGTYFTRLQPNGVKPDLYPWIPQLPSGKTIYLEHLAFSRDGKYLAWVIDTGLGWQEYVFKVPG